MMRQAGAYVYAIRIALGTIDPGMEFYRANADGEGEALLMKAQHEASRQS